MKIAVVGGGISGLAAALILSSRHELSLFESENRLGGHAHTVKLKKSSMKMWLLV
jgi:predicted NAD/FAD-binding protein